MAEQEQTENLVTPSGNRPGRPTIWPVVAAVLLLAAVGGVIAIIAIIAMRDAGPSTQHPSDNPDAELALLQEEFKVLIEQQLGTDRLAVLERKADRFAERYPDEVGGHVLLTQVRLKLGDHGGAYNAIARAVALLPDHFEYQKLAGFCAASDARYDDAERHYRRAAELDGVYTVYQSLGLIYLDRGRLDDAERAYTDALSGKNYGDDTNWKHGGYAGLANVASARGAFDQALELIDRAIRRSEVDSQADTVAYMIQKARIYLDAGRDEDAATMLTHTWAEHPAAQWRLDSARLRARLYERAGDLTRAKNHVATVAEYHLNDPDREDRVAADYIAELAAWQLKAGDTAGARTSIANLKALTPNHPRLAELREQLAAQ